MQTRALNYVAQAERELTALADKMLAQGQYRDAKMTAVMLRYLREAVHFTVPDNAKILDDGLKGIMGRSIRLPFPVVTIEYYVEKDEVLLNSVPGADVHCPRRIVLAIEKTAEEWARFFGLPAIYESTPGAPQILVMAINQFSLGWCPLICGWLMSTEDWGKALQSNRPPDIEPLDAAGRVASDGTSTQIYGKPLPLFLDMYTQMEKKLGAQKALQNIVHDISMEISALLEFLEALSCSNVGHTTLQAAAKPSINAKRIRDGKVPIYETKTLTIKAPGKRNGAALPLGQSGERHSPREHLRRGHIRIYSNGERIWINNTVVNPGVTAGRVDKTYRVTRR